MADPNKDKTVLSSTEMYAFSSVFAMACAEENRAYAEMLAQKMPLQVSQKVRILTENCTTQTLAATQAKCGDEYSAVTACLAKNRREWSKCSALKESLDECFGKNVL
mmetsp:Transcript_23337/g.42317  ORF Transcript_23337/g.42317 Transcript_23337/m.42317 type:complete len:107 (-) Transcript_23337:294-614(-)